MIRTGILATALISLVSFASPAQAMIPTVEEGQFVAEVVPSFLKSNTNVVTEFPSLAMTICEGCPHGYLPMISMQELPALYPGDRNGTPCRQELEDLWANVYYKTVEAIKAKCATDPICVECYDAECVRAFQSIYDSTTALILQHYWDCCKAAGL